MKRDTIIAIIFVLIALLAATTHLYYYFSGVRPEKIKIEDKSNLIRVTAPKPNQQIKSPLQIEGQARGYWFFEASFPIRLYDDTGRELGVTVAQTQDNWMTENFVPFKAVLQFKKSATKRGRLVLEKDNPSGLPENADQLSMPVIF